MSETDFLGEMPVVLSVSRLSQPVNEAPAAVSVIDQDMIRASGFRDIPDLLRLVPGFSVAYTRDNSWAVGYHGMADAFSRRFQVLVDGRSIYNPAYGSVNWGELPLAVDDIERIEVVRGPNAATFGANAFLAVINIITKDPSQVPGAFVSMQYGEQGMAGMTARFGGGQDDLRYRMTLSTQNRDRFETDTFRGSNSEALYEATQTYFLNGRADYHVSASDVFSAQFGVSVGDWQAGRLRHPEEPLGQDVSAQYVQLKYRRAHDTDNEWMVHAYFSRNALNAPHVTPLVPPVYPVVTPFVLEAGIDLVQTRANVEFQQNRRLSPDWRMAWGAELRHETVKSRRYFDSSDKHAGTQGRAYANLEWRARPELLLQAGAMLEDHYFTGADISPRMAINYTVSNGHTLRLSLSQAYRSPTFLEQDGRLTYYTTTGVPVLPLYVPSDSLHPERIVSRELGYVGQYAPLHLQFDAKLFHDTVYDFINSKGRPAQFDNRDDFTVRGGDVQLSWRPAPAFRLSVQYARAFIEADPGVDKDLTQSAPRNNLSVQARYVAGQGWTASTGIYHSGRMKWLSDGDTTPAFTRWDVRLARNWKWDGHVVEAAIVGQNLGKDYSEFRPENHFSRRLYGSLSFAW